MALEGHDTDNAPKGAPKGLPFALVFSGNPLKGYFYALVFLLPVNGSVYSFKLI